MSSAVLSIPSNDANLARSSSGARASGSARDRRLDFWRGMCLVDMVLVHLVYEGVRMGKFFEPVFGEFTRFAAGGFIFLAGLGITYIFLPKARDEARRWGAYQSLWRRSLYLLFVHYAASLSFIFIYPIRDFAGPYPSPVQYVRDVLFFREGSDLLLFYVIMVGVSPAILEVVRRGYAWAVGVGSLILFACGQFHPQALSLPIQQNFMVVLWQMVFVMGALAGVLLPKWDGLALRAKVAWALGVCGLLAMIQVAEYTAWGWSLGISFVKNPLSWGEAVRYVAMITTIMMLTDLAWRWIAESHVVGFFTRLGRRSLAVYVAHVWIVALTVAAAHRTPNWGAGQIALAGLAVAILWAWTYVLDTLSDAPKARGEEPSLIGKAFWRVSGAAVVGVAVVFAINAALHHAPRDPLAKMLAKMTPPANLSNYVADASDGDDDFDYSPEPAPLPDAAEDVDA